MRSPMFSNLGSALRNANAESALYRRWFPGAGQRGGGFAGMGLCDPSDPTCVAAEPPIVGTWTSNDPVVPFDPLANDPLLTDESGVNCLASMFVNGQCPSNDPTSIYANPGYNIKNVTPGPVLTDAQLKAQQAAALAVLAKMVPGTALTAAQIAAGLASGTVSAVPKTVCPSGYNYGGQCVPSASSQWVSFATNNQVLVFGAVIIGALIIVPALSGGGGRRRR
jgi:hypothetical protein